MNAYEIEVISPFGEVVREVRVCADTEPLARRYARQLIRPGERLGDTYLRLD